MDVAAVRADLIAEQQDLDTVMAELTAEQWAMPTPSPGWSVADQIGHLAFFDDSAALAITDPDAYEVAKAELIAAPDGDALTLGAFRAMDPNQLLDAWRANRNKLADASATLGEKDRVAWYGPSMGSKSFLTARLMEAWAHGQDIVDTVGAQRQPTDRLKHIAQLGFITRGWTYMNRQIDMPDTEVSVVLDAPSGERWEYGNQNAAESVAGPAEEFCQVVTQRRHVDDTSLVIEGQSARDWLEKAQAFAGGVSDGPPAGRWK